MLEYPEPTKGASLILAFRPTRVLILGSGPLAASRTFSALEADSEVLILAQGGLESACEEIKWRASRSQVKVSDWSSDGGDSQETTVLEKFLDDTPGISLACITDTAIHPHRRSRDSCERIYRVLKARNIQVNTTDIPDLCDFTFTSTHRFTDATTQKASPLQIGVTTNGQGCRLSSRLRRDIVSKVPSHATLAVSNIGRLRSLAKEKASESKGKEPVSLVEDDGSDEIEEDSAVTTPNRPVPSRSTSETAVESARRRMKWVAQVSEYWPLTKLASLTETDMSELLEGEVPETPLTQSLMGISASSIHSLPSLNRGRIFLVGSGPGHPSLLTQATHTILTRLADLVLSDKLVPDAVLALIPKSVEVRIAKKFPGNAEGAQMEMMEAAIEAANRGLTVVRLKQGDPVVYGRAGEEVLYFRSHGFEPLIIPGVSSALAAPTFAGIPVTQRGAAESFIVCTGVGRRGKEIQLPAYERGRTLVILMGVARLAQVVQSLTNTLPSNKREGAAYPLNTPVAIIERASMPDQRVITSTLKDIVQALESSGDQRPPGMIIVGWSVLCLHGRGDTEVLEEGAEKGDERRVERWLGAHKWRVETGIDANWDLF
ncbi:hypothetical protein EST38_g2765 [Candolleomyces aberdarensis]|uniref:precorrin-2 dehydrogenase n=1 Tax=Candolleomyces aberdarensis TaxID=2316362 RepID=A0A4Q2DTQ4_9AGAR|nr:hypothetical protein EST38_g2765 [Candolleomyces aberdarensis]